MSETLEKEVLEEEKKASCTIFETALFKHAFNDVPVELMYLNNGTGRVEILFQIAELERIEEEALKDEVDYLTAKLDNFSDLLVLLNY